MEKIFAVLLFAAVALFPIHDVSAQQKIRVAIAAGGTGGTYYPLAGTMAEIINQKIPGMEATAEVTGASVANSRMVGSKEVAFAMVMNDTLYQAYEGEGKFKNAKIDSLRTVIQMYPNLYHVVTLSKYPIHKISDLKGKRVSVGAPGSGTEAKTALVFPTLGVNYGDMKIYRLSFTENTTALRDGTIDAGIWSVGPPTSSIIDLATQHEIRFIPITPAESAKVRKLYPFYIDSIIPKNTYQNQKEDVPVLAVWNSVIANKDTPDDVVYKVVKAIFENKKMLTDTHKIAEFITPEASTKASPIPIHSGALKYYKEIGAIK